MYYHYYCSILIVFINSFYYAFDIIFYHRAPYECANFVISFLLIEIKNDIKIEILFYISWQHYLLRKLTHNNMSLWTLGVSIHVIILLLLFITKQHDLVKIREFGHINHTPMPWFNIIIYLYTILFYSDVSLNKKYCFYLFT